MEIQHDGSATGRLKISVEAIEKITRQAALEVDGVIGFKYPPVSGSGKSLKHMLSAPRSIQIQLSNDVADIVISVVAAYGSKIPELSELVQKNVKNSVQNMTGITVGRVDIVVSGVAVKEQGA